jgi:hypothetical protein
VVWLVKLAGTDFPEQADALRGCKLLIRPTDRPPLSDEDEFYAQVCSSLPSVCSKCCTLRLPCEELASAACSLCAGVAAVQRWPLSSDSTVGFTTRSTSLPARLVPKGTKPNMRSKASEGNSSSLILRGATSRQSCVCTF